MKAKYYPEDDLLVLKFSDKVYDHAEKMGMFVVHYAKDKEPVLVEILNASDFIKEATEALPYPTLNKILHLETA
jgi:uncharacterized protein YuzE